MGGGGLVGSMDQDTQREEIRTQQVILDLRQQLNSMIEPLHQRAVTLDDKRFRLAQAKKEEADLQLRVRSLQEDIDAMRQETGRAELELSSARARLELTSTQVLSYRHQMEEMQAAREKLDGQLREAAQLSDEADSELNQLQGTLQVLLQTAHSDSRAVSELDQRISRLQNQRQNLTHESEQCDLRTDGLIQQEKDLQTQVQGLERELQEAEEALQRSKQAEQERSDACGDLKGKCGQLAQRIGETKERASSAGSSSASQAQGLLQQAEELVRRATAAIGVDFASLQKPQPPANSGPALFQQDAFQAWGQHQPQQQQAPPPIRQPQPAAAQSAPAFTPPPAVQQPPPPPKPAPAQADDEDDEWFDG
eukprot:TRINITY_DN6056_c0_g1_i1.p1 TRINITY_DN6056_c0_g1~~TRINITY_DN6056_c0_g1_i1.p1  ORF type:complete len:366 (+),score=120.30 TRINITY_DN6056_c0_g1_i1:3-1100(+)